MNELTKLKNIYKKTNGSTTQRILEEFIQENQYIISLNLLNVIKLDIRQVYMICYELKEVLESSLFNIETELLIPYNKNKIIFYLKGKQQMNRKKSMLNFIIPYGRREDYIDFIYEVNNNVSDDNLVVIFANNIPYILECLLYVEAYDTIKIREIARKYKVDELKNGKSFENYLKEHTKRQWNHCSLAKDMDNDKIKEALDSICFIPTIKKLEEEGYSLTKEYNRVFISYSHKDTEKIEKLEQKIKDNGIPVWRDAYDIEFGESITSKISEAMKESNIFLLCLSKNTLNSMYAKQETETLYNNILIYKANNKIVIPIKLDDIDLNDIILGLNNFKYCDYNNKDDIEKLITLLMRETRINNF